MILPLSRSDAIGVTIVALFFLVLGIAVTALTWGPT